MDILAAGTLERRLLATVYARCNDARARAAIRAQVSLMLSREADVRRALALCDHAHRSLTHAERHDDWGAVPSPSEATDGRSIAAVLVECLDVLATPLRAPEHAAARADMRSQFATHGERIVGSGVTCRMRKHHRAALVREFERWQVGAGAAA